MSEQMIDKQSLTTKLANISNELGAIKKGGKNQQQGYAYIEYGVIAGKIRELLKKYEVIIYPEIEGIEKEEVINAKNNRGYHYLLRMKFNVVNGSNQEDHFERSWFGEATAFDDKGVNKAATAATKYFLMRLLQISEKNEYDPDLTTPAPIVTKKGVDFGDVRNRVKTMNTVEELNEYWTELNLSQKQQDVLKPAFAQRKAEIGGE